MTGSWTVPAIGVYASHIQRRGPSRGQEASGPGVFGMLSRLPQAGTVDVTVNRGDFADVAQDREVGGDLGLSEWIQHNHGILVRKDGDQRVSSDKEL